MIELSDEIEKSHNEIAKLYLGAVIDLLRLSGLKEINFMKKTVTTNEGGVYLLHFQHISGPKIQLNYGKVEQ